MLTTKDFTSMKSSLSAAALALVVFSAIAVPARASIVVAAGDDVKLYRGPGNSGGVFYVDVLGEGVSTSPYDFDTFCVQLSEFISLGGPAYDVYSITKSTIAGNVSLGSFAAWLYNEFLDGGIAIANNQDANAVQVGIWRSMGYLGGGDATSPVGANYDAVLLASLDTAYAADAAWAAQAVDINGNKTGNISIMNLKTLSGDNAQDQLVRMPPPPGNTPVPEPLSIAVWSLLAMCVGSVSTQRCGNRR
jgi:hypothetical protein